MRCLFSLKRMVFTPFCRKCQAYYDGVVVVVVWLVKTTLLWENKFA